MTTAWAHLPNAVHIDRVMEHVKKHPRKWDVAQDAARGAAWAAAWEATRAAARNAAWGAAWDAAQEAAQEAARDAAREAVCALIAWDEAGDLLSQPIEVAKFLADEGNPAAILLYPAMLAMQKTVDTVNNQE